MWMEFSIGPTAATLIFMSIMLLTILLAIKFIFGGEVKATLYFVWPTMLTGSFMLAFPFAATVLVGGLLSIVGSAAFINRVWPS